MTLGIFGPKCEGSSPSAGRKSCSVSRSQVPQLSERLGELLQRRLARFGSMEYSLTWKRRVTPAGHVFYQQRASGRRTSGRGCGGWPTARANDSTEDLADLKARSAKNGANLTAIANCAGWATPQARDHFPPHSEQYVTEKREQGHGMRNLNDEATLAGWQTPNAMDGGQTSRGGDRINEPLLAGQAQTAGWATPAARELERRTSGQVQPKRDPSKRRHERP